MGIVADLRGAIVSVAQKAWIVAGVSAVPDGADIATRDVDGTAGNLAILDVDGNAVDAGFDFPPDDAAWVAAGAAGGPLGTAAYVEAGYWMQKTIIPDGETVTIPDGYQMIVAGDFIVDGELIAIGDLVILD